MMGADAVVDLNAERLPGFIRTERRGRGTAVRVVDAEGRLELTSRWFDRQIPHRCTDAGAGGPGVADRRAHRHRHRGRVD
jgi:hypothetical protein